MATTTRPAGVPVGMQDVGGQQLPTVQGLREYFTKNSGAIGQALPRQITPERMIRTALNCVVRVPKLLECSRDSVMLSLLELAAAGLEPGVAGFAWILPYKGKAQVIYGYKGLAQ